MVDEGKPSIDMDGAVLRRADTKVFLTQTPVPCVILIVMQKGESTDMDMLLLTEEYRTQGIHVLVMDITEDCLNAREERDRGNTRSMFGMPTVHETDNTQDT